VNKNNKEGVFNMDDTNKQEDSENYYHNLQGSSDLTNSEQYLLEQERLENLTQTEINIEQGLDIAAQVANHTPLVVSYVITIGVMIGVPAFIIYVFCGRKIKDKLIELLSRP